MGNFGEKFRGYKDARVRHIISDVLSSELATRDGQPYWDNMQSTETNF